MAWSKEQNREYQRDYQAKLRAKRRAAGQCTVCCKPASGKARCAECYARDNERQKERQRKLAEAGLCRTCGVTEAETGHRYCKGCLEKANSATRKHARKKARQGRCVACGVECGRSRCEECRVKTNAQTSRRHHERVGAGLCRDCGKEAQLVDRTGQAHAPGGKKKANYCQACFFKMTAGYVLGSRKHWQVLLDKLYRADWRCAYTGERLVLGENLSFDHKNPVCRFPEQKHDPDNVEPVTLTVNLMKRHMTRDEFLCLVQRIAENKEPDEV